MSPPRRRATRNAVTAACLLLATGCDQPASPVGLAAPSLSVSPAATTWLCHQPGRVGQLIEVPDVARTAHLAHGDYVARMVVDPATSPGGDGVHFTRITDAVLAARQARLSHDEQEVAACRITIDVAAGTFTGSFDAGASPALERYPLLIDVPDITVRGALRMQTDGQGRATGEGRFAGEVTTLLPDRPLEFLPTTESMFVVAGHPGGSAGDGVVIEGFAFQSGRSDGTAGGMGVIALRARDLVIRGNRFEEGLSSAVDLRSTTARVEGNHGRDLGVNCGICLAGPGSYTVEGNRLLDGGLGAVYVSPAIGHIPFSLGSEPAADVEVDVLPAGADVMAVIRNNDLRGHLRRPIGFAVRTLALGPASATIPQTSSVFVSDNDMIGNTFGMIVDAGFPQANTLLRGDIDVELSGNVIQASCQTDLLVAFTRHTGGLGLTNNPYLRSSTFRLDLGGDVSWNDAWFSHPEGFANTLVVNSEAIGNGARRFYDPTGCPGQAG